MTAFTEAAFHHGLIPDGTERKRSDRVTQEGTRTSLLFEDLYNTIDDECAYIPLSISPFDGHVLWKHYKSLSDQMAGDVETIPSFHHDGYYNFVDENYNFTPMSSAITTILLQY